MSEDHIERSHERMSDEVLRRVLTSHRIAWKRLGYNTCEEGNRCITYEQLIVYKGHAYHLHCAPDEKVTL